MSIRPSINKKYLFLQSLLYQSIDTYTLKINTNSKQSSLKFVKKKQLNSLNNPNHVSTSLAKRENNEIKIFKFQKSVEALKKDKTLWNFFSLKNSSFDKKNPSFLNQGNLKFIPFKKFSNLIGTSLPYKKSFFCYWLLPFMGFISCISTVVDSPSLKSNSLNNNFLSFPNSLSISNPLTYSTNINYLKSEFKSVNALNKQNESSFNLISESFEDLVKDLYYFYNQDLEKDLVNQIESKSVLSLDNNLPLWSCLNWAPLETFKRNEATFKWIWLNSSLRLPSLSFPFGFLSEVRRGNEKGEEEKRTLINRTISETIKKNSETPLEVISFKISDQGSKFSFTKEKDSFFGKRLEKDTYSILNYLTFQNPLSLKSGGEKKLLSNNIYYKNSSILFPKNKISFITLKTKFLKSSLLEAKNSTKHYSNKLFLFKNNLTYKNLEGVSNFLVGVRTKKSSFGWLLAKPTGGKKNINLHSVETKLNLVSNSLAPFGLTLPTKEITNQLNIKSNLAFFLELEDKSYLPNFFFTNKNLSKNPLLSYKKASALIDGLIEPNLSNKLDYWMTKKCSFNKEDINLQSPFSKFNLTKNQVKTSLNESTNNFKIEMNDLYSSMSMFTNKKLKIEKNSNLLEKTLLFLLKKQSVNSKLINLKDSFKSEKIKESFDLKAQSKIDKLNKDSLYFLIFKSLKTSLNDVVKDKFSLVKETELFNKKKENISLNELNPTLKQLEKYIYKDQNLLNNYYSTSPIIKLTHPLLIANLKFNQKTVLHPLLSKGSKKDTNKLNSNVGNKTSLDSFTINKISKETKTKSNSLKLQNSKEQRSFFGKAKPTPLTFGEKGKKSKDREEEKNSKQNILKDTNLINNNYFHLSKYLNFLSKKIKKTWLNPINPLFVNGQKQSLSLNNNLSNLNNRSCLNKSIKTWPFIKLKKISSQRKKQDLKLIKSLINSKDIDFESKKVPGLQALSRLKTMNLTSLELNPPMFRSFRNINLTLKKSFGLKKNKFKPQLLRLEKIFRSYLSKKNNSDKQLLEKIKSKEKNNLKHFSNKSNQIQNFNLNKDFLKLSKSSYLSVKTFQKLKLNDSNYKLASSLENVKSLNVKNSKVLFKKKTNLGFHKKNFSRSKNISYNLSPTLYLKNRSFILKTRTKKLSSKQKNIVNQSKKTKLADFANSFIKSKNLRIKSFSQEKNKAFKVILNVFKENESKEIRLKNSLDSTLTSNLNSSPSYASLLEKRKYERKKRRRKKQRKETRRRKKRKRFYPRPTWLRFKLYSKFLKFRHLKTINYKISPTLLQRVNFNLNQPSYLKSNQYNGLKKIMSKNVIENLASQHLETILLREKIYRNYKQIWANSANQKDAFLPSIQGEHYLDSEYFPFFANKDFYQISRTVLGDLKRIFWKSYWLRSNLNPYLNRVKTYLNDMKESTKNWQIYLNLRNLSHSILGLNYSIREIPGKPFLQSSLKLDNKEAKKEANIKNLNIYNSKLILKKDVASFGSQNKERNIQDTLANSNLNNNNYSYINIKNYLQNCQVANASFEKWQVAINIAEYQRIMYERIQQTVLNIRENLNINGQIRARSSRMGRQKLQTPKPVKDFWIKFGKAITFEIPNSSAIEFYGDMSKLRTWWTLNKSNLASFKSINKRKDLWTNQKIREQSKSNKTKKIVYQMVKNLNSILDEKFTVSKSPKIGLLPWQSQTLWDKSQPEGKSKGWKSSVLIKSLTIKPFFNKFMIDKPDSVKSSEGKFELKTNIMNPKFENAVVFEKLKRSFEISEQKLRKKENKLSYLGLFNKKTNKLALQKNYLRALKKELQVLPSVNNNLLKTSQNFQAKVPFNKFTSEYNYWWKGEALAIKIIPPFKNTKDILNTNGLILWTSTFLFHFCALISLISSSEVRGLIKFHTILVSKIFKTYLDIIFSTYQMVLNSLSPFLQIKSLKFQKKLTERSLQSLKEPIKDSSTFQTFLFNLCGPLFASQSKQRNKILKETYLKQAKTKSLVWSSFSQSKPLFQLNSNNLPENQIEPNSYKMLERNSKINLNTSSEINLKNKNIILRKEQRYLNTKTNFNKLLNTWPWTFYLGLESNQPNITILKILESENKIKKYKIKSYSELIYLSVLNILTKPFLWFELVDLQRVNPTKLETLKQESFVRQTSSKLLDKDQNLLHRNKFVHIKSLNVIKLIILSFLNITISSSYKGSFSLYTSLIKSLDIFQAILGSIYLFLEKPGELIVDWIAYAFLVEWSSDLTTNIPDALDISTMHSYFKTSRIVRPFIIGQSLFTFSPIGISNSLIQRRIWYLYQAMIEQLCQPDTDLIIRQKKGMIFWDIWSELLIDVAEDANINISELTSLKEEQNRLLDKLELYTPSSSASFKNRGLKNINTEDSQVILSQKNNFFVNLIKAPLSVIGTSSSKTAKIRKTSSFLSTKLLDKQTSSTLFDVNDKVLQKQTTWSVNQFLSYQGKDTELFIDLHPPKSFSHIPSIKYSQSVQQPIGTIICQIFSGIFNQQIAKNILVVGSPGIEKTLLIQAIAGETELKIITDNAHRYAMVYRGVAVGIKLLRDVFEALSLHTPCIFLLEDIHHIGERRPFLISDDENTKATEFGSEKEEIHEKNQVIYQLSKHFVSHYKKPYKGDFSLLIPTNHFCFNLFLGVSSPRTRTYQVTPSSPLQFGKTSTDSSDTNFLHSSKTKNLQGNILSSSLQIKSNQLLAPPATSPFSVLILKEEKKLKPKQIVKEMPWSGLPGEQLALISKANYSIRVKIALLADMALSNVSVKLDMITDLLVIIDSVKGNRGFIVFATTHLPYILDPALRRPGRFDETISLPLIPNLFSRWEILKANLNNFTQPSLYSSFPKGSTIDFTNISGIFSPNFELSKLSDKLVNFNKKLKPIHLANKTSSLFSRKSQIHSKNLTITYHLTNKQEPLVDPSQIQHYLSTQQSKIKAKNNATSKESNLSNFDKKRYLKLNSIISIKGKAFTEQNNMNYKKHYPKTFFNLIARTYFYISRIITYFSPVHQNSIPFGLNISIPSQNSQKREKKFAIPPTDLILFDSNIYLSLYASNETLKQHLTHLMAGKLGELFAFSNYQSFENQKNFENGSMNFQMGANFGIMSLYGIDKTWRSASSLLFSVITKRYLYNKNLITPKLLYFSNYSSLHEAPSPPSSNVLLPLKRYENYRRTFNSEQIKHKANFQGNALQATLELHQQQRLVKRLYKLPIREFFRSEIISDKLTGFGNSSITLSSVEKNITKPTNIHWYYRNRILNRHRNYLNTQWWNGQLSEHNAESTFLSDIDWRYTFVESIGDIFIDFPDSDQFYNARNRRWMLTSGSWNNWFNFEKTTLHEIYHQYTLDCFTKAYNSLDQQREVLDFYAFTSLNQCMLKDLKEITIMNIFKRFSQTS